MNESVWLLIGAAFLMLVVIGGICYAGSHYSLGNIKSRTVGDGQHGTARWATQKEIYKTYRVVPFRPRRWRRGKELPTEQGVIVGSMGGRKRRKGTAAGCSKKLLERLRRPTSVREKKKPKKRSKLKRFLAEQRDIRALVDSDDIHCLMIGASGVGKTAFFLYPNLEYTCASGMSFLALDSKGDLARNYGAVASKYYGYHVAVIDLRNPTRSDGYNLLTLINSVASIKPLHWKASCTRCGEYRWNRYDLRLYSDNPHRRFCNSFGDSGSAATSILVAQNRGAEKNTRVQQSFRSSLILMLCMGVAMSIVMYVSASASVGFMLGTHSGEAFENAREYMKIIALFYTLCFTGNTFAGYFNGSGRVSVPFIGATLHISLRVILSYLLVERMGLPAVALATGIGWILVNVLWAIIKYCSKK